MTITPSAYPDGNLVFWGFCGFCRFCGVCDVCFKEFESKYPDLNNHITKAHTKDDYKLCMYNCEFKTEDWKELKIHIDEKHSEHGKKQHFCQVCQKGFIYEDSSRYVYRVKEYHKKSFQQLTKFFILTS